MKSNILVLATHGDYYIPYFLRVFLKDEFKRYNYRLLKNFSDFWTKFLLKNCENKIICKYSRALWDPNRNIKDGDLFMDNDFWWIKIWKYNLPDFIKNILIKKYYNSYHYQIENRIIKMEKQFWEIIILDIHDTWNELLWIDFSDDKKRDYYFPEINLWVYNYESCTKDFCNKLDKLMLDEFWFESKIDWPYDWWYVSKKYWVWYKNRQVVQIEFGRYLYMNEKNQEIDLEKMKDMREKFEKVLEWL